MVNYRSTCSTVSATSCFVGVSDSVHAFALFIFFVMCIFFFVGRSVRSMLFILTRKIGIKNRIYTHNVFAHYQIESVCSGCDDDDGQRWRLNYLYLHVFFWPNCIRWRWIMSFTRLFFFREDIVLQMKWRRNLPFRWNRAKRMQQFRGFEFWVHANDDCTMANTIIDRIPLERWMWRLDFTSSTLLFTFTTRWSLVTFTATMVPAHVCV